jgi:hypothetical protein
MPSPVDTLVAFEWIVPEPGTNIPYAVVRKVTLRTPDGPVEAFRVVTYSEPRTLIRDGYYPSLRDAAQAGYMDAISRAGSGVLSDQDAYKNE